MSTELVTSLPASSAEQIAFAALILDEIVISLDNLPPSQEQFDQLRDILAQYPEAGIVWLGYLLGISPLDIPPMLHSLKEDARLQEDAELRAIFKEIKHDGETDEQEDI